MTTGIVVLGALGLLLQAEGGGDLGLPLGPGGANMVRNDCPAAQRFVQLLGYILHLRSHEHDGSML